MDKVVMEGKTVEEAVAAALEVLKVKKEEAEVKVLEEAEGAMLGVFGGRPAKVEVSLKVGPGERARGLLQQILDKMGFMTLVGVTGESEDEASLEIKGEDMGRIIGKEGATLDALQYLASLMLSREKKNRIRIQLDAEGYRERRQKKLQKIASEAAEKVRGSQEEVMLDPMNPAERRIIHLALQEEADVSTYSKGEKNFRRVVVAPKGKEPSPTEEIKESSEG